MHKYVRVCVFAAASQGHGESRCRSTCNNARRALEPSQLPRGNYIVFSMERWGADRGSRGQKAVGGMVHAELVSDGSSATSICRVHCTFVKLGVEAEGTCQGEKGVEGLHIWFGAPKQEGVISICQGPCQVHCSNLFEWPLQDKCKY
jgi:hypothetical protein